MADEMLDSYFNILQGDSRFVPQGSPPFSLARRDRSCRVGEDTYEMYLKYRGAVSSVSLDTSDTVTFNKNV